MRRRGISWRSRRLLRRRGACGAGLDGVARWRLIFEISVEYRLPLALEYYRRCNFDGGEVEVCVVSTGTWSLGYGRLASSKTSTRYART